MKVAVDFGTKYTKIAYLDRKGEIQLFGFGSNPEKYIPSAVTYYTDQKGKMGVAVGLNAYQQVEQLRDATLCEGFKLLLPLTESDDWLKYGWRCSCSPSQATQDFFRLLLLEGTYSFTHQHGPITSLVVTVPELWQRSGNNLGTENLLRILKDRLSLPVESLLSEPVCAAAYYLHRHKEEEPATDSLTLFVNDVGGGTYDAALCRLEGLDHRTIKVLDFDGNGHEGHGAAGVYFDRLAVAAAHAAKHAGEQLAADSPNFEELRRQFEDAKITCHDKASQEFDTEPDDWPVYLFCHEEYDVTIGQAKAAFAPIGQGITDVIRRIKARAQIAGYQIDRVAIVGGFGQFPLVRKTILAEFPNAHSTRYSHVASLLNAEEQVNAVVRGAAHILRGDFTAKEYYPHSWALRLFSTFGGRMREERIILCEPDQIEAGSAAPTYARLRNGQPATITVHAASLTRLPLECKLKGSEQWRPIDLPETQTPSPGRYRVGFSVNRSNLGTLIFEPVTGGDPHEYRLGDVKFALTAGE